MVLIRAFAKLRALISCAGMALALFAAPVQAQTGIFSFLNPDGSKKPVNIEDVLEDHAAYVATGAPMAIGPSADQLKALPKPVPGPLPPRRITPVERPAQAEPAAPEPAAPPVVADSPRLIEVDPGRVSHAALQERLLAPGPPQQVTPQEIEEEEAQAPEPSVVEKQTEYVNISCLKPELMRLINDTGKHFKAKPVITSGQRDRGRRGSYHRRCMAADFFVPGVERAALARYLRRLPQSGGVGTYCHTKSVHLDMGEPRNWYQCGRRFSFSQR